MNLENIMLSERNQAQQAMWYMVPFIEMSRTGKSIETEHRFMVAGAGRSGEGKMGSDC